LPLEIRAKYQQKGFKPDLFEAFYKMARCHYWQVLACLPNDRLQKSTHGSQKHPNVKLPCAPAEAG